MAVAVFAPFLTAFLSCLEAESKPEADLSRSLGSLALMELFPCAPICGFSLLGSRRSPWGALQARAKGEQGCAVLQGEASRAAGARSAAWGSWRPWWAWRTGAPRSSSSPGLPLGTSSSGRTPCCWGQWRPMMDLCLPCMPWTRYLAPSFALICVALMDFRGVWDSNHKVSVIWHPVSTPFCVLVPDQLSEL